jgi:hypothetical protein
MDCFLFSFEGNELMIYNATFTNSLFQIATNKSFQLGGGGDGAGLFVGDDLQDGATHWSETYDNDPLTNDQFGIVHLEVWGFVKSRFAWP